MRSAILLGATGLTGSVLLKKLLQDDRYSEVKVFSRRSTGISDAKVREQLLDLFELEKVQEQFIADEVFCCIGSTKAKTPDLEVYERVDHGIPVTAARMAKKNGINTFVVVSALDADPESKFFYNRTKGKMEHDVLEVGIPNTYILQPALIGGKRKEKRIFEYLWKQVMKVGDHLLVGPLAKYRRIHPEVIANAMIWVAENGYRKSRIESDEIKEIGKNNAAQP